MPEGTKERIQSHIPYPELYDPQAVEHELTRQILGVPLPGDPSRPRGRGANESIVTPIDLRRTAARLTDEEIIISVSTHLDVSPDALKKNPRTGEERAVQEKVFVDINIALSEAHRYIQDVLGLSVPLVEVHSQEEVVDLIRKTSLYRATHRKGLEAHAGYCALVSVALAVFELQKKEAHTLETEMKYLEGVLMQASEENDGEPLFFKHFAVDTNGPVSVVINGVSPQCQARLSMRDKTPESQITKYLMKPESTAEEALKDAIGMRLELDKARVEDGLVRVLYYLQQHFDASDLQVEDRNLMGVKRMDDFKKRKAEEVPNADEISVFPDTSPLSADSFRAIKITGNIKIPRGGTGEQITRPIEVQLVEPENKNESGLASHAVYELKKHITVMTRLFGGCSQAWIKERAKNISNAEGFVDNVINGLQNPRVGFLMQLPRTKKVYAATSVYRRWLQVDGLITDNEVRDQVLHKLQSP